MEIIETVGIMIFNNHKILLNKPRLRPTFQIVGGCIEQGETPIEAIIRETNEELGKNYLDKDEISFVMDFVEKNTAFPDKEIHMHLFIYHQEFDKPLHESEEIEKFIWYSLEDEQIVLSDALEKEIIPYAIYHGYM